MRQLGRTKSDDEAPSLIGVVETVLPTSTPIERSFEKLYLQVRERAIDDAERLVGYDAACDAFHAAALKVWKRWKKLQPEDQSAAYFLTAVHNQVIDYLRRDERHVELTEELEESPEFPNLTRDPNGEVDVAQLVDRLIGAMPTRRKQAWILARDQKFTYQQIAAALGVSVATVDTHLRLARESIRNGLERAGFRLSRTTATKLIPPKTTEADHD